MTATADIASKIRSIYSIEQLSGGQSVVHRRHPLVKLVSTFLYIVLVVSFDRDELGQLIPFVFYPAILMALSDTPWSMVLRRAAVALPFCVLAGVSNIIFDTRLAAVVFGMAVSSGVVSFFAIVLKTVLSVTAVLILVAVTPLNQLTGQLRRLRVPDLFVSLFEMIYRYLGVLASEAASMMTAYRLRSGARRGLQMRHMGSAVGQLLVRSVDRAERVYAAMKCRGYPGPPPPSTRAKLTGADYAYLAAVVVPFVVLRVVNVTALFARLL